MQQARLLNRITKMSKPDGGRSILGFVFRARPHIATIPTGYLQSGSHRCWDSGDRCSKVIKRIQMSTVMNGSAGVGLLAKERTIVGPGYNRWMAPPAALLIHLCIGMAYGLSTFWLP